MQGILVSLFDSKAETWTPPTVADSKAAAIRQFEVLVNSDKGSLISLHPEDFQLWQIGAFKDGCVSGLEANVALANGVDVQRKRPEVSNG